MALLEVKDLVTEFGSGARTVRAVDHVSFHVDEGETLALVGESGCGKSVTALSVMRLVPPAAGRVVGGQVLFDGEDLLALPERRMRRVRGAGIAMVFQDPMASLNPALTIGRQLTESLRLHLGLRGRAADRRAAELLEMVGIPRPAERLGDHPHQFSGGMRQRVMIAMALSCEPRLILAVEITTALDVTIQAQILELLRTLARDLRTSVVFITHDLGVVAGVADRVNVMYGGRIVERGTTEEILTRPAMPYTWGLLSSVPRLDRPRQGRLRPIEGQPPDLADPPPGCRFAPRCRHVRDVCMASEPVLVPVPPVPGEAASPTAMTRCWGMAPDGWLTGAVREAELERVDGGAA